MDRRACLPSSAFSTGSFPGMWRGTLLIFHWGVLFFTWAADKGNVWLLPVACVSANSSGFFSVPVARCWNDAPERARVPFLCVFKINRCHALEDHKATWPPAYHSDTGRGFPALPGAREASCRHWLEGGPPSPHTRSPSCHSLCHISDKQGRF